MGDGTTNDRAEHATRAVRVFVAGMVVRVGVPIPMVVRLMGLARVLDVLIVLAVAVVALAELVDVAKASARLRKTTHERVGTMCVAPVGDEAQNGICHEAHDDADGGLRREDAADEAQVDLLGHEQGQHLVGRGEEDRKQRAKRHDAAGEEGRPNRGEAALRKDAEDAAHDGSGRARLAHDGSHAGTGRMLKALEHKVGDKQERNKDEGVLGRVGKNLKEEAHRRELLVLGRFYGPDTIAATTPERLLIRSPVQLSPFLPDDSSHSQPEVKGDAMLETHKKARPQAEGEPGYTLKLNSNARRRASSCVAAHTWTSASS